MQTNPIPIIAVVIASCCCSLIAEQQGFVLKARSNLVVLDISVTVGGGTPVPGLTRDRFEVAEDGRKQRIDQFSSAETPVSMGLVVDMSGSMHPKADSVRRAMRLLVANSSPADQYFVAGFNDRPRLPLPQGKPFLSKPAEVERTFAAIRYEGRTALYDGVAQALDHLRGAAYERRVLVLLSDGKDTASRGSLASLIQQLHRTQVTIHTIGLYADDELDEHDSRCLKTLARISGGVFYHPTTQVELEESCLRIARDIRARYTLAYRPQENGKSPLRKIKVMLVKTPTDKRSLKVHARTEYSFDNAFVEHN